VLKSAGTLNHLTDHRQAFKLVKFVTIQCSMVIKNHAISIHDTTRIYNAPHWLLPRDLKVTALSPQQESLDNFEPEICEFESI
jgi:hypothetical protein